MPKLILPLLLISISFSVLLTACAAPTSEAASTVEEYLSSLASHDGNQVSNLSCQDWETDALLEVDSFQLVNVTLEEVSCAVVNETAGEFEVQCTGAIVSTYNNEVTRIDLAGRVYRVIQEKGDFFVCGYQ